MISDSLRTSDVLPEMVNSGFGYSPLRMDRAEMVNSGFGYSSLRMDRAESRDCWLRLMICTFAPDERKASATPNPILNHHHLLLLIRVG